MYDLNMGTEFQSFHGLIIYQGLTVGSTKKGMSGTDGSEKIDLTNVKLSNVN